MMAWLRRLFPPVRCVVVRRDVRVKWTNADAAYLASVLDSGTWRKLMAMSDDSMICDLTATSSVVPDPEFIKAFVRGRVKQLDFIYMHAGKRRLDANTDENTDWLEDREPVASTSTIQITEG